MATQEIAPRPLKFRECKNFWKFLVEHKTEAELNMAFESIKPEAAEALHLHFSKGMTLKEMAAKLKRSDSTVRNRLHFGCFLLHKYFYPDVYWFNPYSI